MIRLQTGVGPEGLSSQRCLSIPFNECQIKDWRKRYKMGFSSGINQAFSSFSTLDAAFKHFNNEPPDKMAIVHRLLLLVLGTLSPGDIHFSKFWTCF